MRRLYSLKIPEAWESMHTPFLKPISADAKLYVDEFKIFER